MPDTTQEISALLGTLAALPDPQERLAWIVDYGRRLPTLPVEERTPANRVPGCVSAVWLVDRSTPQACLFHGDAEAPILRGLVSLICARASDRPPAEVAADTTDITALLRLERHLTPTRLNGIRTLQEHIRRRAAAIAAQTEKPPAG